MQIRKLLFLVPLLALAVLLLAVYSSDSGTSASDAAAGETTATDPLASYAAAAPQGTPFQCPSDPIELDYEAPIGSIHVTVRAGTWLADLMVPAPAGSTAQTSFIGSLQSLHTDPDVRKDATGQYVLLKVNGGIGQVGNYPPPYQKEIVLDRCTDHEGFLRRIHVDGPDKGAGNTTGQPAVSVTGIYDRLMSRSAVLDQAYACRICDRVKVCGPGSECD